MAIATRLGLSADDAVVLNDSNKLTLRLLPCDAVARVAPEAEQVAELEVDLARRLAGLGAPVAALDPRVEPGTYSQDGFVVTWWTYHPPVSDEPASPADYASALLRLHAAMRGLDVVTPHVTDRVDQAVHLVTHPDDTPDLSTRDRIVLADTLHEARTALTGCAAAGQLLHGEPHPGNLLQTSGGLVFVDFETACRGPLEFDLAHAPHEVAGHYPGVDEDLLATCRLLVLAMVTAWRWDRNDHLPDGRRLADAWMREIRTIRGRDGRSG